MHYSFLIIFPILFLIACSSTANDTYSPSINYTERGVHGSKGFRAPRMTGMLATHNRVRREHGLQPLRWSNELADYARRWAHHLAHNNGCRMRHSPQQVLLQQNYGENLFWASPTSWSDGYISLQPVSAEEVVVSWASEVKDYSYPGNRCRPGKQCGHYTQIVWRDTQEVGCGVSVCPDKGQIWACNYAPAGNWIGERPY